MVGPVEREAIARERRRRQATEELEFEREREAALQDQLEDVVTDHLGPGIDDRAFAAMSSEDAAVVREAIGAAVADEEVGEELLADWVSDDEDGDEDPEAAVEAEIARLEGEIEES